MEALSALVAGSFAATGEVARLLGEDTFSALSHQGAHQSIQVSTVGDRTLLAVVWDQRSNLGLVRFYSKETTKRLEQVFDEIATRLAEGGRVELRGFGAFSTRERKARVGRNPRTGEPVDVPAKRVPYFKPGKEMRERLNAD